MHLTERYQPGTTYLHQFDPRLKIVVTVILILGIVQTPDGYWLGFGLQWLVLAGLAWLGHISPLRLARLGGISLPFTLAAITLIFTTPGPTWISLGPFTLSTSGTLRFITIVIRSWLAVQCAILLSTTTALPDLLWALGKLRVPAPILLIIGFMYRYLFVLQDEALRLMRARQARSAWESDSNKIGGNWARQLRVSGAMIGTLLVRSYERSERIYMAMLARGYQGQIRQLDAPRLSRQALMLAGIPILLMVVIHIGMRVSL
jgi:cobalt/nickel transport system permease protein